MNPFALIQFGGLLAIAFLVTATEAALATLDKAERQRLSSAPGGKRLVERLQRLDTYGVETTLLILDTVATIAAIAAGFDLCESLAGVPTLVGALVLVPVIVLFTRVTARALALSFNHGWARIVTPPLVLLQLLLWPLSGTVNALVGLVARLFRVEPQIAREGAREAEIMHLITQGAVAGTVNERERDIVEAVFDFGGLTVGRLMTPRPDMFAVPIDMPPDALLARCRETGFSRVPVYRGRTDEIVGVLLLKDLLRNRAATVIDMEVRPPIQIRSLLLPPTFVPQSKPANAMLREFLAQKQHMAFVVDEHGTLVGLITLDDLLSQLVGNFLDQETPDEMTISRLQPGVLVVKAWMDVEDFIEETSIAIPRDGYHTVGGFLFHQLGRLPHKGDAVRWGQHRFVVHAMEGRRIAEILIQIVPDAEGATDGTQDPPVVQGPANPPEVAS